MDTNLPDITPLSEATSRLISVVLSFRNEEGNLDEMIRRLEAALDPTGHDYELIFVNDVSTDRSREILERHLHSDPHIRLINMSNNFGVIPCSYAGFGHAQGDAVITLDCDLQDPPEVIPEMLTLWTEGAEVVHAKRTRRKGEPFIKLLITKIAYRVLKKLSDIDLPVDTGLFKVLDRRVIDQLLEIEEQDPYLRGLVSWVGYKQDEVLYEREPRFAGKTHFPLFSTNPIREFSVGIISFSRIPLAAIMAIGLALTGASLIGIVGLAIALLTGAAVGMPHFAFAALMLLGGIQLTSLGIVGLYLGRVYRQTRGRPHYIIESAQGFPEAAAQPAPQAASRRAI